jgi:pilus assembly protein CpaE
MMPSLPTRVHVLVLRDEITVGYQGEAGQSDTLLPEDPRLRVTVARSGYGEAVRAAQKHRPDLVVLDGVMGDPVGLVGELDEALQKTPVLVILDELERDRMHDCIVAGARACLIRPVDPNVLARTILQVHQREVRRRKQLESEVQSGGEKGGRIVALRGAKGGVGATTLATNLAVALRRKSGKRVALVDANLFGGDVPVALNLVPTSSISELIPHLHALDDDLLGSTMMQHSSGVSVLAAPSEFERAEAIRSEELQRILEALRARYDYVIVDCAPFVDHNTLVTLDLANLLLLVSTPEIVALKNAARFIQLGLELGYSDTKLRFVVNRMKSRYAISRADFEKHLDYPMSFAVPNDQAVLRALMRGEPLVVDEPRSRAARAIDRLANVILANQGWEGEAQPAQNGKRSWRPSLRLLTFGRRPEQA